MEFDLMALINQYVSPEILIAVPFLMFVGKQLKLSARIDDTLIVNCLCYVGVFVSIVYNCSQNMPKTIYEWFMMIMISFLSGMVLAYTSVGVHQQLKQREENKLNETDKQLYE